MIRHLHYLKYFGLFILLSTYSVCVQAVDRTFVATNGNWNLGTNWSPAGVPAESDNVFIPLGKFCNLDISVTRSGNVSVANGATLKLLQSYTQNGGLISISSPGIFDIKGQSVFFNNGCNVSGTFTTDAATNFGFSSCPPGTNTPLVSSAINNITIGTLSTVDLSSDLTCLGTIAIGSGNTLIVGSKKLGISSRSGFGVLQVASGPSGSTIEYIGSGPLTINNLDAKSLILNRSGVVSFSGTNTLAGQLVVSNNTTVKGIGFVTIQPFSGSSIHFTNNGIFSLTTATSIFNLGSNGSFINNNTVNQIGNLSVGGQFENYGDFIFSGIHSVNVTGSVVNGASASFNLSEINPTLTINVGATDSFVNHGIFKTGTSSSITISSNQANGFQNQASGTFNLASTITFSNGNTGITNLGTIVLNPGTFAFSGSGSPVINLPKTQYFNTIQVNKTSGIVSLAGSSKLVIQKALNVNSGTVDLGNKQVLLPSSSTGTGSIGPIGGTLLGTNNITLERYVSGLNAGWYFLGSSILAQSYPSWTDDFEISGPFPGASVNTSPDRSTVFVFDGAASPTGPLAGEVNGWRLPSTGSIINGLGYRVFIKSKFFGPTSPQIIDNTGDIVKGNFSFPVTFDAQGYGGGGWNFLSNTYPSQINWNSPSWTKTNIGGAIYVWNGQTGQYGAYNFANDPPGSNPGTNGVSNILASGQAFFVRATGPNPVLQAAELVKSSLTSSFIRTATRESSFFRITLSNLSGYKDDNVVRFHDNSTTEFDYDFDAVKMVGSVLNLSTTSPGGSRLCINTIPRLSDEMFMVPLNATSFNDNALDLTFSDLGNDAQEMNIFLRDKYTNTMNLITEGYKYRFLTNSDPASKGDGRFELLMTKAKTFPTQIIGSEANLMIYSDPSNTGKLNIKVLNPKPENGHIRVVDALGRVVYSQQINPMNQIDFQVPCQLTPGMYFVEFQQTGLNLRSKALVRK